MKKPSLTVVILLLTGLAGVPVKSGAETGEPFATIRSGGGVQIALLQNQSMGNGVGKRVSNQETSGKESFREQFNVAVGQEFTVTLASNATTGYHWELAAPLDEAVVKLVNSEYRTPETSALGAPGQEIWTFQAVGQGRTVIDLKYVRPWEKDVAPVETASYEVAVH
jgi:inhibitor of cysteine peptidase